MKRTTPANLSPMKPLHLSILSRDFSVKKIRGPGNPLILDLAYNSRLVKPGALFFAFEGTHTDGHLYIREAVSKGAVGIVHSRDTQPIGPDITYMQVEDTRLALSSASAGCYGDPSRDLTVIGVTGTDGKSTTVWFIQQLLEMLGERSGFISTVNLKIGTTMGKNPLRQSTPEALEIQKFLAEIRKSKNDFAVLEATSHGLSDKTRRLAHVFFDVGVLTNVTHEHLEFHRSLRQYRSDKANLFRGLGRKGKNRPSFGVVNKDDPHHGLFIRANPCPTFDYSMMDSSADLSARDIRCGLRDSLFTLVMGKERAESRLSIPGSFNIGNLMAAVLTVCRLLSRRLEEAAPLIPRLTGVRGRMEAIDLGQSFHVIVDYAHTPGAFEKLFPLLKPAVTGKLITVFGSAGERDRKKRPAQGRIAGKYSDILVLTDEDPRGEDPLKIIKEIASGCQGREKGRSLFLEPDRRKAIGMALEMAGPGDMVLCLGKGHEESIIYADGPIEWNEAEITRELLRNLLGTKYFKADDTVST